MRYRLIATHLGAPYQAAFGPEGDEITLFAACPPPEELGFGSAAAHWRKVVPIDDLDNLRQSRPAGRFRGERCLILDDQGDRLHIAYLGRDPGLARELGYWEIDREVFEMVVPRADVTELTEEQADIPLAAAAVPVAAPIPVPAPVHAPVPAPVAVPPPTSNGYHGYNGYDAPDRVAAWHGSPEPESWTADGTAQYEVRPRTPAGSPRAARRERIPIQSVFAELLDLAAIPQSAYAVDEEVPGAMCLLKVDGGYEVFASSDEARLEVRFFEDEEAAYFYLFGVLAAEEVRNGRLVPGAGATGLSGYSEQLENVSKYLRGQNCPNSPRTTVRVLIAGGADGPPLPKQPRRPLQGETLIPPRITKRAFHHFITHNT
jgi:hypothetical protein